jgi:solute carrier family 25 thiamine pyrophosphate transporter 19
MDWRDACAGMVSGVTARCFVAPLDVIKIRLQLQVIGRNGSARPGQGRKYTGVLQTLRAVAREEGVRSLWKGNLTAEFLWGGYMAVQFVTYRALQRVVDRRLAASSPRDRNRPTSRVAVDMMCGGLAGGLATGATYPFDLIRTRLSAQPEPKIYRGLLHAARQIVAHERVVGLYQGLTPALVSVVPYMGIQFAVYEALKRNFRGSISKSRARGNSANGGSSGNGAAGGGDGGRWREIVEHLLCGFLAGSISKFATLPLDVTKKRMQVSGAPSEIRQRLQPSYIIKSSAAESGRTPSMLRTWAIIFSVEGLPGFFRGGVPR